MYTVGTMPAIVHIVMKKRVLKCIWIGSLLLLDYEYSMHFISKF